MTYLIVLICFLIASLLFAGAFYLAKYVVTLQHRCHVLEDSYTQATEHISKQEETIAQMQSHIDHLERENHLFSTREERPRSWNPSDPLNSRERSRR